MNRRHDSYEDYCKEIDEEAERKAHDAGECEGIPLCTACLEDWEEHEKEVLSEEEAKARSARIGKGLKYFWWNK